jgi:protoheme IX farnesyltransferase
MDAVVAAALPSIRDVAADPMSVTFAPTELPPGVDPDIAPSLAGARDYLELMKPRVMSLVVFTALVGLAVAPGHIHPVIGLTALICIAVGAGASGALNMWYDADIDARMARTAGRPIPAGRLRPGEVLAFGLILAGFSVAVLGLLVNVMAAALLALTIAFYVVIYTMWLKRTTPQNIVIGGAAGALPPIIGWASVTGNVSFEPVLLFLIIFMWTPPHFWALALYRKDDYARAGVPMLPVVAGDTATRRQILLYTLILAPLGVAPWLLGYAGLAYGVAAIATGAVMIVLAVRIHAEKQGYAASKQMFAFSILYLFLLFAVLLADRMSGGLLGHIAAS